MESRIILKEVWAMSGTKVARVTDIIAESPKGFEDAVQVGFARAASTLRGITGLRIVEQRVSVKDNKINTYRVKMEVIFILDWGGPSPKGSETPLMAWSRLPG
jgi:flavin-binding protein dodecin